jgi:hypothetical protein
MLLCDTTIDAIRSSKDSKTSISKNHASTVNHSIHCFSVIRPEKKKKTKSCVIRVKL